MHFTVNKDKGCYNIFLLLALSLQLQQWRLADKISTGRLWHIVRWCMCQSLWRPFYYNTARSLWLCQTKMKMQVNNTMLWYYINCFTKPTLPAATHWILKKSKHTGSDTVPWHCNGLPQDSHYSCHCTTIAPLLCHWILKIYELQPNLKHLLKEYRTFLCNYSLIPPLLTM